MAAQKRDFLFNTVKMYIKCNVLMLFMKQKIDLQDFSVGIGI
jgi:hypothetical protein